MSSSNQFDYNLIRQLFIQLPEIEKTDFEFNKSTSATSLIVFLFRMVENGIKPVFVFDGKPPTMKVI